jgi:Rod binding domain-containing protein
MAVGPTGLPPIDESLLPAKIRTGSAQDKKDYTAALGFEQMLVSQLTKSMTATANPLGDGLTGDDSSDSGDSSSDSSNDGTTSSSSTDAATSAYLQMMPDQLASSIMSNGGLGLAQSFYDAIRERR